MARWSDLIWDDAPMQAQQVQSPVPRPAPVPRPGEIMPDMPSRRPAVRQQQAAPDLAAPSQPGLQPPASLPGRATDAEMQANTIEADALMQSNNDRAERDRMPKTMPEQPRRWSDQVFDAPAVPQTTQPAAGIPKAKTGIPTNANAEPDAPTWLGRRAQDIMGKQDPRYRGIPAIAEVLLKEGRRDHIGTEVKGWTLGASDEDMGKNYAGVLGDRFIGMEKDANGYPLIRYKDKDGQPAIAYVNVPGLEMQDVARGAFGALPFMGSGIVANAGLKAAGLGSRMLGQGAVQAATSASQDVIRGATGYGDMGTLGEIGTKAAVAGAMGAGGEAIGAAVSSVYRRLVTEPRLFDASKGELTEAGLRAAREAGLPDDALTPEFAKQFAERFARTGNAAGAARESLSTEFKVPRTLGEATGDRQQLLREQQMRGGTYGEEAKVKIDALDRAQRDARIAAVRGEVEPGTPGIAGRLAPERAAEAQTMRKADAGTNIRENTQQAFEAAKTAEREAWAKVPTIKATPEALAELDAAVAARTGNVMVDDAVTPMAARMAKALDAFKAGEAPAKVAGVLPSTPAGDVGVMRKRLLAMRQSAQTPEDARAAKAIYDSFTDWEVIAAEKAGDLTGAASARAARTLTREIHDMFDGKNGTAGANILGRVLSEAKNDSAEGVVNALFTGPTSEVKNGALSALGSLKKAYDAHLSPEAAKAAWDDLRLAYWLKVSVGRDGQVMEPAALAKSIKQSLDNQRSVVNALFSPDERVAMRRLALTMDQIKAKNPNTSWSGIAIGSLMRDMGNAFISTLGINSILGRTVAKTALNPIIKGYGSVQAGVATGGGVGAKMPALPPPSYGWAGGYAGARSEQD